MPKTIAVAGHRPPKLGGYIDPYRSNPVAVSVKSKIKEELLKKFTELEVTSVISGMALGVDQFAAEVCIENGIPFTAALPCTGQHLIWPDHTKAIYEELLSRAALVVNVTNKPFFPGSMQIRNQWMVDRAESLIAVWDGTSGGTGNCVAAANAVGKAVIRIGVPSHTAYIPKTPNKSWSRKKALSEPEMEAFKAKYIGIPKVDPDLKEEIAFIRVLDLD